MALEPCGTLHRFNDEKYTKRADQRNLFFSSKRFLQITLKMEIVLDDMDPEPIKTEHEDPEGKSDREEDSEGLTVVKVEQSEEKFQTDNNSSSQSKKKQKRPCNEEKPYSCLLCKKTFKSLSSLDYHMPLHSGERPFDCDKCGKKFVSLNALESHVTNHERPCLCPVCGKAFSREDQLRVHQTIHTGVKDYVCQVCDKGFRLASGLARHIKRVHTREKPFKCSHCESCFSERSSLKVHERCHTGEKPHQCLVCEKRFTQLYQLQSHMKSCHSESTDGFEN